MQLVTCRRGASCRHRRCCHRTGMGEGAHLRTKIEFGPRRLGAQPDVLLMRFSTAQHYIHLQKLYRIYIYIDTHSAAQSQARTLLPKMSASSSVTVSCVWQKKMIYSRSGLAGDCRNNLCRKTKDIDKIYTGYRPHYSHGHIEEAGEQEFIVNRHGNEATLVEFGGRLAHHDAQSYAPGQE